MKSMRSAVYSQLEPSAYAGQGLSSANRIVSVAIVASVVFAVVETEPTIAAGREALFDVLEVLLGGVFLIEYVARVWCSAENPRYAGLRGRLRYIRSGPALLDLLALTPLVLSPVGAEAYLLRLFRLVRVLRLARLGRFSEAVVAVTEAVRSRRFELVASVGLASVLLLLTSTLMYLVEGGAQPEAFGSILRASWWSIATLTTVGYGDMVPITAFGRLLAGLTALIGIGLIAMPTGILAAAFSDAMQARRSAEAGGRSPAD